MVKRKVGLWGLFLCGACGSSTKGAPPPALDAGAEDGTGGGSQDDTGLRPDGSQAPAIGSYQSGSRLHAHYWDGGDGATMFLDWHDAALDITCQFAADTNGTLRCLPVRGSTIPIFTSRFLDSACTERAVLITDLPARRVPPYATATGAPCGDDPAVVSVYAIGEASPSKFAYTVRGTTCITFDLASDEAVFPISPVEPSIFLPAHTTVERRGPRLDVEVIVADDGARQLGRMLDHERGASCAPLSGLPPLATAPSVAGATCLPAVVGLPGEVSLHTDCTDTTMGGWDCPQREGCNQTSFAIVATSSISDCTATYDVIALATEAAPTYANALGPCATLTYGSCKFYPQSASVDWSTFPALAPGGIGTGRLSRNVLVAEGDGRVLGESKLGFRDGERSANCQPRSFSDEIVRCLPEGTAVLSGFFADAACTQPIIAADACGHAPPLVAEAYEVGSTVYPNVTHRVFAVGDAFRAPTLYRLDQTGCLELPHGDTDHFWIVGAELDRDTLPRLIEKIDP